MKRVEGRRALTACRMDGHAQSETETVKQSQSRFSQQVVLILKNSLKQKLYITIKFTQVRERYSLCTLYSIRRSFINLEAIPFDTMSVVVNYTWTIVTDSGIRIKIESVNWLKRKMKKKFLPPQPLVWTTPQIT